MIERVIPYFINKKTRGRSLRELPSRNTFPMVLERFRAAAEVIQRQHLPRGHHISSGYTTVKQTTTELLILTEQPRLH